jgi:hypothetical protein
MNNSDQNKKYWEHLLKRKSLNDFELIVLTMGRDPEAIEYDEELNLALGGDIPEYEENSNKLFMQFKRRKDLINDWRFTPFPYLKSIDGSSSDISCFSDGDKKIDIKRFLAWYGYEKFNWEDMPEEMAEMARQLSQGITTSEAPKDIQKPLSDSHNADKNRSFDEAREQDLRLIGVLLEMLKAKTRTNHTQESITTEILEKYPVIEIKDRSIKGRFAEANNALKKLKR